jgi:hypothetical protein
MTRTTLQPPPNPKPDGEDSVSHKVNQTREEILEYWTDERMAEAQPRELRLPKPGPPAREQD